MIHRVINGYTAKFMPPPDCDEVTISPLHVRVVIVDGTDYIGMQSAWEPTPAELELLNKGGSVILTVLAGQMPPVSLSVESQ